MSYTIPTSVQTKAEAVLAVASAIADTDMGARYDGTVNTSLDVLADVLAAQDVDVPQTNAGAILALAQYAHGGGGGAQTLDVNVWNITEGEPLASVLPTEVRYATGFDETYDYTTSDPLPFERITGKDSETGTTIHGVRVNGLPVGAFALLTLSVDGGFLDHFVFGFTNSCAADERLRSSVDDIVPSPIGGLVVTGVYELSAQ